MKKLMKILGIETCFSCRHKYDLDEVSYSFCDNGYKIECLCSRCGSEFICDFTDNPDSYITTCTYIDYKKDEY